MAKHNLKSTLKGHTDVIWCVAWAPNGKELASCGADKTIRIWNELVDKWVTVDILSEGHTKTVRYLDYSKCGSYLASVGFDSKLCIWQKYNDKWEILDTLDGHENEVKCVKWNYSGEYIATCGRYFIKLKKRDKRIIVYGYDQEEFECSGILQSHTQDIKTIEWDNEEDILFSGSYDNTVKVWTLFDNDWICRQTIEFHQNTIWSLSFGSSFDYLAVSDQNGVISIWKEGENVYNKVCNFIGSSLCIYGIEWEPDSDSIAVCSRDNSISIFKYDINSNPITPLFELDDNFVAHESDVNCVKWNPVVKGLLVSCSDDYLIKIWQLEE